MFSLRAAHSVFFLNVYFHIPLLWCIGYVIKYKWAGVLHELVLTVMTFLTLHHIFLQKSSILIKSNCQLYPISFSFANNFSFHLNLSLSRSQNISVWYTNFWTLHIKCVFFCGWEGFILSYNPQRIPWLPERLKFSALTLFLPCLLNQLLALNLHGSVSILLIFIVA